MQIALDPYMLRRVPLTGLPGVVADLGYEYLELSPREDFLPFFVHPRAGRDQIAAFRRELAAAGVQVCSVLPLYRWSGPDELVRGIDRDFVSFLYCAPHTFHQGGDIEGIMKYAGQVAADRGPGGRGRRVPGVELAPGQPALEAGPRTSTGSGIR